jgi:hypothetical protein
MTEPNDAVLAKNPAYRPATEKALETGLFLRTRFAGDSSGSPRDGLTAVSMEPLSAVARRGLEGCAGYEPLRETEANTRWVVRDPTVGVRCVDAHPWNKPVSDGLAAGSDTHSLCVITWGRQAREPRSTTRQVRCAADPLNTMSTSSS